MLVLISTAIDHCHRDIDSATHHPRFTERESRANILRDQGLHNDVLATLTDTIRYIRINFVVENSCSASQLRGRQADKVQSRLDFDTS
jgi:hypothetical protein